MESVDKPFGMIVGRMMHAMFRVLRNRTNEQTEAKLTIEQFGLLFAISKQKNDIIQKDVAGMMGKDKSAILRMIYSLEKKDWFNEWWTVMTAGKAMFWCQKKGR
ncbi:hypothetical protein CYCD_17110 [Tenuifilaceae bacterium CYCD]|nr:hypothetical protein CYCD_17110 [Tenuifilaceae bacterium CYCD]